MRGTGKSAKKKSKPPPLEDKEQFQRFVETARAIEVDESGKAFERALRTILPKNPKPKK